MNKLCRYDEILTILIPDGPNYHTYPIEDYDFDIPMVVSAQDPNISMISIAKLHFSEARNIIRMLIDDVTVDEAVPAPSPVVSIASQKAYQPATKAALAAHAIFNKEY